MPDALGSPAGAAGPAVSSRRRRAGRGGLGAALTSDRVLPYLLVAPAVLLVFALTIYPTVYVLLTSFTDWNLMRTVTKSVGAKNYVDLLADDLAIRALVNTVIFLVGSLALILILGLVLALALNEPVRFRTFFRSTVVLPWALTAVVVGVMWRWILLPDIGIVNYMLSGLGINVSFFLSPSLALATMIVVEVWRSTGYGMILVLAGLQGIDGTLYEAARFDEVALHVDDHQRGAGGVEGERVRLGGDACHRSPSLRSVGAVACCVIGSLARSLTCPPRSWPR